MTDTGSSAALSRSLPWFYGWNIVAVGMMFQALTVGTIQYGFTFFVEPWMGEFEVGRGTLMLGIMAAQMGSGLLSPIVGRAMDSYSLRWLIASGILAFAGGVLLTNLANTGWQVILLYAPLMALAMALSGPLAGQTLAAKWFRARRGTAMGWIAIGTSLGGFAIPPLVTFLLAGSGWRTANAALAGVAVFVVLPVVLLVIRSSPEDKGVEPEPEMRAGDEGKTPVSYPDWTVPMVLRSRNFWIPVVCFTPAMATMSAVTINYGPYADDVGVAATKASFLVSVLAATMVGGKMLFGALADRVDHRALFSAVAVLMMAALMLMAGTPSYALLLGVSVLWGLAGGGLLPLSGAILGSRFGPASFGRVMGLMYLAFVSASTAGPIAGYVRDAFGSYDPFFYAAVAILAVATVPVLWLHRAPQPR